MGGRSFLISRAEDRTKFTGCCGIAYGPIYNLRSTYVVPRFALSSNPDREMRRRAFPSLLLFVATVISFPFESEMSEI